MYKPYNEKFYRNLRLFVIALTLCIFESIILNLFHYNDATIDPLWNWCILLVVTFTAATTLNFLMMLLENCLKTFTKWFRLLINLAWAYSVLLITIGLLK